jgi:hypothetical protein
VISLVLFLGLFAILDGLPAMVMVIPVFLPVGLRLGGRHSPPDLGSALRSGTYDRQVGRWSINNSLFGLSCPWESSFTPPPSR